MTSGSRIRVVTIPIARILWQEGRTFMHREPSSRIQAALGEMRAVYVSFLPRRFEEIREAWERARAGGWEHGALVHLHSLVYSMAGSCAVFGFNEMARMAYELQHTLATVVDRRQLPSPQWENHVEQLLDRLEDACVEIRRVIVTASALPPVIAAEPALPSQAESRPIYLVTEDEEFKQDIPQLEYFGYEVVVWSQADLTEREIHARPPAALVVDLDIAERLDTLFHRVQAIRHQAPSSPVPVIFVSTQDDLTTRLEAVRAGGDAFLAKPVDIGLFIERLENLIEPGDLDPYRILIVEDEPAVAEFYAYVLKEAGMVTRIVTKPLEIMPVLVEFNPDLILMDIYMPECSGVELAKVIRQMESFVTVPIVFLSGESDVERQLDAMSLGGDDFLMKPILPQHLVKSVRIRVERSRILRQLTLIDGLTGLLNHTAIEERLHKEIERARRQGSSLAFAMIDLDHFKHVNDTHGHLVGDRILRTLSRVLRQNLRKTDVIGRYGGEEFAVILLDTDGPQGARALDNVRQKFARIKHRTGHLGFQVTFSCGVAAFPEYGSPAELHEAADQALYEAKRRGRNQTILSAQGYLTPVTP